LVRGAGQSLDYVLVEHTQLTVGLRAGRLHERERGQQAGPVGKPSPADAGVAGGAPGLAAIERTRRQLYDAEEVLLGTPPVRRPRGGHRGVPVKLQIGQAIRQPGCWTGLYPLSSARQALNGRWQGVASSDANGVLQSLSAVVNRSAASQVADQL